MESIRKRDNKYNRLHKIADKRILSFSEGVIKIIPILIAIFAIIGYTNMGLYYLFFRIDIFYYTSTTDFITEGFEIFGLYGFCILLHYLYFYPLHRPKKYYSLSYKISQFNRIKKKIRVFINNLGYVWIILTVVLLVVIGLLLGTASLVVVGSFMLVYNLSSLIIFISKYHSYISHKFYILLINILSLVFASTVSNCIKIYDISHIHYTHGIVLLNDGVISKSTHDTVLIGITSDYIFLHSFKHSINLIYPKSSVVAIYEEQPKILKIFRRKD